VRIVVDLKKVEEPVELAWGEERQLSLKANEWEKLIFRSFTGVRTELGPTSHNPFITVVQQATGKVSVTAADPRTLNWKPRRTLGSSSQEDIRVRHEFGH